MKSRSETKKIKLSNKATLLIEENHSTPIVSFCAYFKGGVRHETEAQNGITYLTQAVLLKGTEKFSAEELAFKTEAIGSVIIPFTDKDAFGVYTSVLAKHLDKALELFLDPIFHPIFPPSEVEKEKQVVLAEIQESRGEIYSHCLELCDKTLFAHHPYRFPIKGNPEVIQNFKQEDLVKWHQTWYHPNNLIFSIVGDFSIKEVEEKVSSLLENLPKKKLPKLIIPSENGERKKEIVEEREKRQLAISIGFLAPQAADEDRFPFEVLNGVLSGMGARLFIELRDKKGLAYSVGSRYDAVLDYGILKTYMGTSPEKESQAKEGLLEELWRLKQAPPSEEELQRAKRYLIGLYEIARQKKSTQALRFARYEMLGSGWRTANQYPKKIEAVQADQVQKMAEQYLNPDRFSCAVIRPK